ncbi:MAG: AAA-like domain-containing protein [Bacteroidia bacterium]|nr:AAA-like domain-containing protein [Bacteroidia bacterium]
MRRFNTSGPNIPEEHYTLERTGLIQKGIDLVQNKRYFTIWAPRQTGKSTYFYLLAEQLKKMGYKPAIASVEDFKNATIEGILKYFNRELSENWETYLKSPDIPDLFDAIAQIKNQKLVLIIDEIENYNPLLFNEFLHSIRKIYHTRNKHSLKSVILVGVSNIVGIVSDNASPFNITDNLDIPYFTDDETAELLGQHELETGQIFEEKVKRKISEITANQPGLVNGFAYKLVEKNPGKKVIIYEDYLEVEHWYLHVAIDKNFANILNKAKQHRGFVEKLLFEEKETPFEIDKEEIKILHTNGLIRENENHKVEFWVPFYKKRLYNAFYPFMNGEEGNISRKVYAPEYFLPDGQLNIAKLIDDYRVYVKRRGFGAFREKDENGNYKSIKEAALIYSFETYIHAFIQEANGKSYRESQAGLGKSDLLINIKGMEILIESKIYYSFKKFESGKGQLAYYCNSLGLQTGIYLVFASGSLHEPVKDNKETINGVEIITFIIPYDEKKDFTVRED